MLLQCWTTLVLCWLLHLANATSDYGELLNLRILPQAQLLASFDFKTTAPATSFERSNFRYFPRALSQILQYSHTKELHLRFTTGRWDEESWGPRPRGGIREGSTGVELWAWVEAKDSKQADEMWYRLTNAMSGLFCSSLNFIDSTRTIAPQDAFSPEAKNANFTDAYLRHGTLAREVVCTENLTPFMKLMPCKGKAGISSLFDGHKLFDSTWQSMSVDFKPYCVGQSHECIVMVEQSVDMVLDIERSKRPQHDPIPRPLPQEELSCDSSKPYAQYGDACYPSTRGTTPAFSLYEVFGRPIKGTCALVQEGKIVPETVCVDVLNNPIMKVNTTGNFVRQERDARTKCFQMPVGADFDLSFAESAIPRVEPANTGSVQVERTISGRGQEHGGMRSVISNKSPTSSVSLVYLESIPWFVKPYLHTLRSELAPSSQIKADQCIKKMNYRPGQDRKRGTMLELTLDIPAAATLTLSYDFDKSILRYTEYPPDPNRGFEIAPAIVRVRGADGVPSSYIRTTSLLLYLPTPDFSMPYNVIILTSTVIALGFGSMFNILVRRFVAADEVPPMPLALWRDRIQGRIAQLRAKYLVKDTKTE